MRTGRQVVARRLVDDRLILGKRFAKLVLLETAPSALEMFLDVQSHRTLCTPNAASITTTGENASQIVDEEFQFPALRPEIPLYNGRLTAIQMKSTRCAVMARFQSSALRACL